MKYIAVGASSEAGKVVVVLNGIATVELNENYARKLADDLLRNANYLWPIKEQNDD
jgi:hypothetical protein